MGQCQGSQVAPVDLGEKCGDYGINAKRMAKVAEIVKDLHLTWHEVGSRKSERCSLRI